LSASRRWRKEAFGAPERRNPPRGARFETNRLRKERFLPKRKRRSNRLRPKASLGQRNRRCVTARRWRWPRWFKPAFVRLRGRGTRRGITTETSEAKIANDVVERIPRRMDRAVPPKQARLREQASFSNEPGATPANRSSDGARVQRGREKIGWHPLVGSICGAPLVSARESRQQESV
jgi:hypothetical protein